MTGCDISLSHVMFVGSRTGDGTCFSSVVFSVCFSIPKQGGFATPRYSHQLALADVEDPGSLTFDTLIRRRP